MSELDRRPDQLPPVSDRLQAVFWSLHSWTWDNLFPSITADRWAADLIAWFISNGAVPPARVIDLGCATGRYSRACAAAGFDVIGLDFAPGMLRRAQAAARVHGFNISFQQANLNAPLPFGEGSIDHALCRGVLQCVASPSQALAEIRRVLRPGGLLNIGVKPDPGVGDVPSGVTWGSWAFAHFKHVVSQRAGLNRFTIEGLRKVLGEARFQLVEDRSRATWIELLARAV